ncbi:MAG: hypothetical protein JWM74_1091, partial [Myxococcaceae bacterium]|nr:hypothetical protein [Myxococcaceae bacterium]
MSNRFYRCQRCSQRFELLDYYFNEELGKHVTDEAPEDEICEACVLERAAVVPPLDVTMVFGKGGPLANGNPHYEA